MLHVETTETLRGAPSADEMPRVRAAAPEDFEQIMRMCRKLHEENGVSNVDWTMVAHKMMQGINQDGAIIGVIGDPGALRGLIYMQMSHMWYSQDTILEELFNYVLPEHRRSNNAKALIDFGKTCSDRLGVPLLIGIISNQRTEEKVRLYRRRLGPPAGAFFLVNARTGNGDVR